MKQYGIGILITKKTGKFAINIYISEKQSPPRCTFKPNLLAPFQLQNEAKNKRNFMLKITLEFIRFFLKLFNRSSTKTCLLFQLLR